MRSRDALRIFLSNNFKNSSILILPYCYYMFESNFVNSEIIVKFERGRTMTSNKTEINFMITKLYEWNEMLGGSESKRALATSEFDFLQEEFLSRRHKVDKYQDIKEREGITAANAHIGQGIRDGIEEMKELLVKLKDEERRLIKKKKDPPEVLERKSKIVRNCEELLKDIEQRQNGDVPKNRYKQTTLTEMKAKLLKQIDQNNNKNHVGSDGQLSDINQQQQQQKRKWKKKDDDLNLMIDDITVGIKGLRQKVKNINELQDTVQQKQQPVDKKINDNIKRIKKDNDQLKKIIEQFKPNRCCLFIALFLLFAGLIVVIIKILI